MELMRVTVEPTGSRATPPGVVVVKIAGEIGITSMVGEDAKYSGVGEDDALTHALDGVLAAKPKLVVADMSEATYLSSIGMGALLRFGKHLTESQGRLKLAAVSPLVFSLLERCRLEGVFDIVPTVDAGFETNEKQP